MTPTVIRGHLAAPGSAAEAYLVAWSELLDSTPDPDALRAELARVRAWRRSLEGSPDPVQRTLISRRGRYWPWYRRMVRTLAPAIATAVERREEAAACLLRAQMGPGYLGEDPQPLHPVEFRPRPG